MFRIIHILTLNHDFHNPGYGSTLPNFVILLMAILQLCRQFSQLSVAFMLSQFDLMIPFLSLLTCNLYFFSLGMQKKLPESRGFTISLIQYGCSPLEDWQNLGPCYEHQQTLVTPAPYINVLINTTIGVLWPYLSYFSFLG